MYKIKPYTIAIACILLIAACKPSSTATDDITLSYAETLVTKTFADGTYKQWAKKKKSVDADKGKITYSSSNTDIATVDASTGEVSL